MIYIKENSIAEAWRSSLKELHAKGLESKESEFYRYSYAVIEISDTLSTDTYDDNFPMSKKNVEIINNYLVTGENEEKVIHEWTKIYRRRLFHKKYNQIESIIKYLTRKPAGKRAQASIWNQEVDLYGRIGPCMQLAWFQIMNGKLEMHVHMRATDCYGKLLLNMNEFISLQNHVSNRLGMKSGTYVQFIDSLHFNERDKEAVDILVDKI